MKRILSFLFVLSFFALLSCENRAGDNSYYYPVDSLLKDQSKFLSSSKARLTKEAFIDGETESKTYIPRNDTTWQFELDVFAQLNDINKPTNAGKYKADRAVKDVNSNLLIYTLESTEKLPVSFLKIYYLDNLSNIRKIEGVYHEESSLLSSARHLSMEFQNINNKIVLTSYSMKGGQKMLLGDSVQFSVHGTITLP